MLRAVYVRTLKEGVTDDDYIAAWMPDDIDRDDYPARVSISHSNTNERQTVTTLEFEANPDAPLDAIGPLVHPDWRERVAAVVETTELESITEVTSAYGSVGAPGS